LVAAAAAVAVLLPASAAGLFALAPWAGAAGAPACTTSGLVVWLNTMGNGAAGSIYYALEFTNLSGHRCTLAGYPGVSAVDLGGRRIGAAAARDPALAPRTVTLGAGANVGATLQIVDAGNFSRSACRPVTAAGLRVYPPNQRASKVVPFPFAACGHGGVGVLRVRAVR
jgi:hypothetical protein